MPHVLSVLSFPSSIGYSMRWAYGAKESLFHYVEIARTTEDAVNIVFLVGSDAFLAFSSEQKDWLLHRCHGSSKDTK